VSAWIIDNGYFDDGFRHKVKDDQFFGNYPVADLNGDGSWNIIASDGGYHVYAPEVNGDEAPGYPKFTGGWNIATAAVGDINGNSNIDVVIGTREGWLWAWESEGHVGGLEGLKYPAIQWASFHHDDQNTGNAGTPLPERERLAPANDGDICACSSAGGDGDDTGPLTVAGLFLFMGWQIRRRRVHVSG
jgi:MYXO-CTERM domain-containing protein